MLSEPTAARSPTPEGTSPVPIEGDGPTLIRRRPLPSGRAVAGGLLVALAAIGVFLAAQSGDKDPGIEYLVASEQLDAGSRIEASDLEWHRLKLTDAVASEAFASLDSVVGGVLLSPLTQGELVQASAVSPPNTTIEGNLEPSHEVSIPFEADHAPDHLAHGERVSILATFTSAGEASTRVIVSGGTVLDYHNEDDGFGTGSAKITLAVSDPQAALELAHVAHTASLTIVRDTLAASSLPEHVLVDGLGFDVEADTGDQVGTR